MDSSESSFPQTSVFLSDQSPSLDTASDSDNDGFVSGEEGDFEPESTRPVLVKTSAPVEEPQLDGPIHEAHRPIAKVTEDDDGSVEDADDVAEGDADGVVWQNSGDREESGEAVKDGDFSDSNEVFVEASGDDDREGAVENGVDADKGFEGDGVELDEREEEEKAVEEVHDGGTNHLDSVVDEKGEDEGGVVEKDFVDGVEAAVDSVESSLLGTGVVDELDVQEPQIKGLHEAARVSLDNGFDAIDKVGDDDDNNDGDVIVGGGDESVVQNVDGPDGVVQNVDGPDGVIGGDDEPGENGVSGDGLKSDIVVPREEGGGSEFVEQNEVTKEGDVEGEIENHVEEKGDDEVERGHHGDREIDGLVSDEKIGSSGEKVEEVENVDSHDDEREINGSVSDGKVEEVEEVVYGSSAAAANKFLEDLELQQQSRASGSSRDEGIDGQIVTDSDEEETDDEGDGKELFDTATLAALLKAASGGDQDGGSITITSQDGSRLFSVERPAGLGSSLQSGKPAMRPTRPNLFSPSISRASAVTDSNLSEEEKKKLNRLQEIRVKYLRLVHRLGFTTEESIAAQVLYRMTLVAGRQSGQMFSLESAKETATRLEAEGRDDLDFSVNILVLGKAGVGKSATINSIFGETKTSINSCGPATTAVTEIVGVVDGVKIRIFDTPGLKSSAFEQNFNTKVLSAVKKLTKKSPPDIVLYVDRLDLQTRDMNDLPMLRSITSVLGSSIWRNVIVTLTHAASAPPDGPSGAPLSYDVFVAQRSHIVQQTIGQAVGDIRLMNPSLMNPVSLVENHPSCRKNRDGQKVLPNGQSWRPLLLLLCFSMKILSEAGNASKAQESFDHRRLFGFRTRSPPLPYLLSWLLQSRTYPKLPADQGGADNGDSDTEMADLSDSDLDEDEDEYDQLPPFKPMKKSQVAKLTKEQQKAYLEEYEYRVKLLQKKQWREELRRMREMKKRGNAKVDNYGYPEEDDQENGTPAAVPVPLPDMALPPSFDSDNPAYRYRFLEPTSQLLTRPVLDNHGWDHDCGYDGVNIEHSLAIINKFPAGVTVQITKDKKDFSIHLDSSVAAKLGENGSSMAGFDIQNIGKQLAYIVRGETKFKNFKRNKTSGGVSVTFLGENVSTGLKIEDQIAVGKRLVLVGSTGIVKSQTDSACGANLEVRLREADFPIGQDQSSLSLSLVKWRGDLALGANLQSQFSLGRSYKMAVRAGLNNKLSGQISVRTSSSDQLQIALVAILPIAKAIYKNFWPGASENYSIY
ncbi:translocase of chloroplast 159, chloroplastic isoform X2 [Vigna umbellata]|uniref:translocase of chloroplast 159, chloroplastic isoform X1 n=1 Tax=Vigna umbellata TaxID=87088 RepID=UPI001F5E5220|nr:translocase of chloroplast 159, chloroplastic isoform X1 [Vigna umbellata]XP_047170834.1 translocase of chloroplast 159, chloroplastic isoform X2 [Vigna umbellata]